MSSCFAVVSSSTSVILRPAHHRRTSGYLAHLPAERRAHQRTGRAGYFRRREKIRKGKKAAGVWGGLAPMDKGGDGGGPRLTAVGSWRTKKRSPMISHRTSRKTAAAYSPTWWGSTIGDGGLNFSVRNGKRWFPAAIATAICYLREITQHFCIRSIAIHFLWLIFLLRKDLGLLVQVD